MRHTLWLVYGGAVALLGVYLAIQGLRLGASRGRVQTLLGLGICSLGLLQFFPRPRGDVLDAVAFATSIVLIYAFIKSAAARNVAP